MKQVIWNKKQVTVAALGAVVALTSFGAVQVSAAVNEAGTGGDTNVVYGVGSTAVGANSVALGKDANAEGAKKGALIMISMLLYFCTIYNKSIARNLGNMV